MAAKVIICRCEDVTLADLEHAVALGYTHIEEAKRYTGLGTGPCQGKECMAPTCLYLARAAGQKAAEMPPFTARPPLASVSLGTLAHALDDLPAPAPSAHDAHGASAATTAGKAATATTSATTTTDPAGTTGDEDAEARR